MNHFTHIKSRALFDSYGNLDENELWFTHGY